MANVQVRPAQEADSVAIWTWRNDPDTRAASVNNGEVSWPEHQTWFQRSLSHSERNLLVGEYEGAPIGIVRFDATGENTWEISINVAPEARGQRLSVPLLEAGRVWLVRKFGPQSVVALIRRENSASLHAFELAGYVPVKQGAEYITMRHRASAG